MYNNGNGDGVHRHRLRRRKANALSDLKARALSDLIILLRDEQSVRLDSLTPDHHYRRVGDRGYVYVPLPRALRKLIVTVQTLRIDLAVWAERERSRG
jgi:hypothetical protein